ncbi:hypothetical protein AAIA72_10385 [Hahella sp. SMD15-11]|uniref:Uncharacterized protein n=1 Tax=Thermohahella caldifontis TaxID=3142973 RepID=A0AB39US73_9GAMM
MSRLLRSIVSFVLLSLALSVQAAPAAPEQGRLFVHLKTSLKHDDAQICVAYNIIWTALREGLAVDVLVDADAINTFRTGMFSSSDSIQGYKIPENLRSSIAAQLKMPVDEVPRTYGEYLERLAADGARFYINKGFLVVSGIAPEPDKNLGKIAPYAAKLFKPVDFQTMLRLRRQADFDYTY